jgi:alkylation response protein AidB-like acyl-CoA dehydrogenase
MPAYTPPLRDMQFVMHEVLKVTEELKVLPKHAEVDAETINAVLEEGGKFASEVTFPLNINGDEEGCVLDKSTHEVKTPKGFKEAYAKYVEGGWAALSCDPQYGGQGLPFVVNQCFYEMLNSANQAWTMYPGLSHGAYEALSAHGTEEQKKTYLPKLTSGEWTGTMCLTEPHCGTDLGLLRTKAEPQPDGSYRLTGNKIFISAGEHDMAENIIHLVLARLPDAPKGSKGISLFVVPKFNVKADGSLGERNGIYCGGLEHKMGIHGNATAQIVLEGAAGTLVGEPNKGLAGDVRDDERGPPGRGQPVAGPDRSGVPERAGLCQGPHPDALAVGPKAKDKEADPIIVHPDVRKMLLTAKAYAEGGRALAIFCTLLLDKEHHHPDEKVRKDSGEIVALLTPIVKAFITDNGHMADQCLHAGVRRPRLHQGMGHGAVRARQPHQHDLRRHQHHPVAGPAGPQGAGQQRRHAEEVRQAGGAAGGGRGRQREDGRVHQPGGLLGEQITKFTTELGFKGFQNADEVGAAAVDYLRVAGHLVFGYFFGAHGAAWRCAEIAAGNTDPFYQAKLQTARFYFAKLFPETATLMRTARSGSANR